jgi:hypothetical protein
VVRESMQQHPRTGLTSTLEADDDADEADDEVF